SEHFYNAGHTFNSHGIDLKDLKVNLDQMIRRKEEVVKQNVEGIQYLMKKNKVDVLQGKGSFVDKNTVKVTKDDGSAEEITGKNIIIATGSKPSTLPFIEIDKERIITSTEALKLKEIPKHLLVIGGGVIGLELGQVYSRLGAEVTVVEYMDRIIPTMDSALSKELTKVRKKQGMKFNLRHKVKAVERKGDEVSVKADDKKGNEVAFKADYCLVSGGRNPFTGGLKADAAGVEWDDRGTIPVNEHE